MKNKFLIFLPTYNESENVQELFTQISTLSLAADILFLDDNSPDGTGNIIDTIISKNENVFAIHRQGKLGIGSAHKEGIRWAYDNDYETLITMDCDFTHSPEYILDFVKHSPDHDVVIGSRYMDKNSLKTWVLVRKLLTHLGHFLTRTLLGMPYDSSGAFRLYNLKRIPKGMFELVTSNGYSFFFESLFILHMNKQTIYEIPISLPSRTYGSSKMSLNDIYTSVKYLGLIFWQKLLDKQKFMYKR